MDLSFVGELKRRRVFRALIGYGIIAFAVLQIIEPLMHGLRWPESVLSFVVVGLAAGFPIVVGLAWIFDVGPAGIERTPTGASPRLRGARLTVVLLLLGILAAAPGLAWYFLLRSPPKGVARAPNQSSIAVLPFANLSNDKDNEYFSDGITEELINALASVDGLHVVARTSAFTYKGRPVGIRQIASDLGVSHVLEGSVRRQGNALRVTAQLVDSATGYQLWSKTYERELKNVFALEDELARAIVQALRPRLLGAPSLVPQATSDPEAHDLDLKARYLLNKRTPETMARARDLFLQAVARDPGYARAHSGIADSDALLINYGVRRRQELRDEATRHARKAVELDPSLSEAHCSLGILFEQDLDWAAAEREHMRAIELSPGYADAHRWFGWVLLATGRLSDAWREAEQARQLDPASPVTNSFAAVVLYHLRDYDRTMEQARRTLELDANLDIAGVFLARAYLAKGLGADALKALDGRGSPVVMLARARVLATMGDRRGARQILDEVLARPGRPVGSGVATAYLALGDVDQAFAWLEKGVEERDQTVTLLKTNPDLDPIRKEPRFRQLLRRARLE